jgi:hypothetical protein
MNSHAHVILELPAPKNVSNFWNLHLSASFSSQGFSRVTRSRDRQSATNTPSYRCCPGFLFSLFSSTASCAILPVHRFSPALNAVALRVQVPMIKATIWYFMTPWAPHRNSLIQPSHAQVRISNAERSGRRIRSAASAPALMLFAKICSRASKSACPLDVNPPDREREREREI